MLITKREEVTKQDFCKYSEENSVLGEVSYWNLFTQVGGVGVSAYLSSTGRRRGGAYSRLGAYSDKYGIKRAKI